MKDRVRIELLDLREFRIEKKLQFEFFAMEF